GDWYLQLQQQRFPGRPDLALAAYNAGPTATANAGGAVPPQAQGYVNKGMALLQGAPPQQVAQGAPPGTVPPPGSAPQMPPTGMNAPMVSQALEMMRRAQDMAAANPYNVAIQHAAQAQIQYAQTLMGLDQFQALPDGRQVNLRTGQEVSAAAPLAHYVQTPTGSIDTTGTHAPTFMQSPRIAQLPSGATMAVGSGGQITPVALPDNA